MWPSPYFFVCVFCAEYSCLQRGAGSAIPVFKEETKPAGAGSGGGNIDQSIRTKHSSNRGRIIEKEPISPQGT